MNEPNSIIISVVFKNKSEDFEIPVSCTFKLIAKPLESAFTVAFGSLISFSGYKLFYNDKKIPLTITPQELEIRSGSVLFLK